VFEFQERVIDSASFPGWYPKESPNEQQRAAAVSHPASPLGCATDGPNAAMMQGQSRGPGERLLRSTGFSEAPAGQSIRLSRVHRRASFHNTPRHLRTASTTLSSAPQYHETQRLTCGFRAATTTQAHTRNCSDNAVLTRAPRGQRDGHCASPIK